MKVLLSCLITSFSISVTQPFIPGRRQSGQKPEQNIGQQADDPEDVHEQDHAAGGQCYGFLEALPLVYGKEERRGDEDQEEE